MFIFNLSSFEFCDLGVIMVGVVMLMIFWIRVFEFNYGVCIDVYVWGENIFIVLVVGLVDDIDIYLFFDGILGVVFIIVGVVFSV